MKTTLADVCMNQTGRKKMKMDGCKGKRRGMGRSIFALLSVMVFLSGMAVQAGVNWEFNLPGDTEGWSGDSGSDLHNSLTNGVVVTNAVSGSEVVLTTPDVTGIDPQLVNTETNSAAGEYWSSIEIKVRQLDGNGGSPVVWSSLGCALVINDAIQSIGIGGSSWDTVAASNEWIVTTLDLPFVGTNDITSLRVDPVGNAANKNFEVDYIRLTTSPTPPPLPVHGWEFNSPGDTEEWVGGSDPNNSLSNGVVVTNAVSGSEVVLTAPDVTGIDPQLILGGVDPSYGNYWTTIEIRARQLDGNGGSPIPWVSGGCAFVVNGALKSNAVGGSDWNTVTEAGEWIVTAFDMSYLGITDITNLRIDPMGSDFSQNFEVDYIRLDTRSTPPLPPAPSQLVKDWEFNTGGDTEDFTALNVSGLTVSNAINGSESVLTSTDVTGNDPQLLYNAGKSGALTLTPEGPWETMEIRIRQLDKNPGDAGVASQAWSNIGTLVFVNPGSPNSANLGAINVTTSEADNWIISTIDISYLGANDFINLRLDPVGNDDPKNFEIDYIRLYSEGGVYDAWVFSFGLVDPDALPAEDPDSDTYDNLFEFSFGGNPTNPAVHGIEPLITIVEDGGTNWFEYVYARRSDFNSGLEYSLELNDDLVTAWTNIGDAAVVGVGEYSDDYDAVTNRIATDASETFLRVNVEKQ
jgi:hypothetical protein